MSYVNASRRWTGSNPTMQIMTRLPFQKLVTSSLHSFETHNPPIFLKLPYRVFNIIWITSNDHKLRKLDEIGIGRIGLHSSPFAKANIPSDVTLPVHLDKTRTTLMPQRTRTLATPTCEDAHHLAPYMHHSRVVHTLQHTISLLPCFFPTTMNCMAATPAGARPFSPPVYSLSFTFIQPHQKAGSRLGQQLCSSASEGFLQRPNTCFR